jgi:Zn-dependent M28 family amino/carboxypeptidase
MIRNIFLNVGQVPAVKPETLLLLSLFLEKVMSRTISTILAATLIAFLIPGKSSSQSRRPGESRINSRDLETYVTFLSSPLLKGRSNGEPELEIAENYIASQASLMGLKPANGQSFFQSYAVMKKSVDYKRSKIQLAGDGKDTVTLDEEFVQLLPQGASDFVIEGDLVFAGYGLRSDKFKYNDFENLKLEGKIVLIMNRSPLSEDGKTNLFDDPSLKMFGGLQTKITPLAFSKAKAVLIVPDPKSSFSSIDEQYPGIAGEMKSARYLKGAKQQTMDMPGFPKIIFVTRKFADEILSGTGQKLDELQRKIDSTLKPSSFDIPGKKLKLTEVSMTEELEMRNVAGMIEGSDPVLRNEFVVYSAHADHIGAAGGKVNQGADDDASGCAAILDIAGEFQGLRRKPLRSILFLWVSGEEIGLFGSQSYVGNPLVPLDKTVCDINMDMIGRDKGPADTTAGTPMTGPKGVFVITDNQSKDLMAIAAEADKRSPVDFDYSLSGRNHPLQLFQRSDHFNFVRKDIPVLFFTGGLHTDYHTPGDIVSKLDFTKMELVAKVAFDIGYSVANRKARLVVDNPYSKW